jgi:hypothetical protein
MFGLGIAILCPTIFSGASRLCRSVLLLLMIHSLSLEKKSNTLSESFPLNSTVAHESRKLVQPSAHDNRQYNLAFLFSIFQLVENSHRHCRAIW